MAEGESAKFSESVGHAVREYTWLAVDAFMLLLLITALLGYREFDEQMRTLVRGAIVAFWWYAWVSGLHLLVYLRHVDRALPMPAFASYPLFCSKLLVIGVFAWWAQTNGLLRLASAPVTGGGH